MTIDAGAAPSAAPPPITRDDLLCPLCEYPLRGLVDPRCPECGHTFDWAELLDRESNRHPFLFESQPKRNVGSFFRTLVAGFRPKRFFTVLKPSQTINTRRLVIYWFLCVMLLPISGGANQREMQNWRMISAMMSSLPPSDPWKMQMMARFGSVANYVAYNKPTIGQSFSNTLRYGRAAPVLLWAVALLLWPWLTFAALMIFRYSLRLARIRSIHVLRCAIYASDAATVVLLVSVLIFPSEDRFVGPFSGALSGLIFTSFIFAIFVSWRLGNAYKHYLRFRHPLSTAIASQVIVFLATLVVATQWFYL
jgi:hypothetical protein